MVTVVNLGLLLRLRDTQACYKSPLPITYLLSSIAGTRTLSPFLETSVCSVLALVIATNGELSIILRVVLKTDKEATLRIRL